MAIIEETKQQVRERANYLCEYCHSPERLCANRFTFDHIINYADCIWAKNKFRIVRLTKLK